MRLTGTFLTGIALGIQAARAHSYITSFIIDGVTYGGFHPRDPDANPDVLAAWKTTVPDDGWVGVNDYETPDIVCHLNATNANGNLAIEAGNTIHFQWNGWPESHHGPVITYMAYCGEDPASCARANKTDLEFFTIDEVGLISPNGTLNLYPSAMGIWATDQQQQLHRRDPPALAPGNYVLRHEIIALHYALEPDLGPQHYPQILPMPYPIPGPELIEEAAPSADQTSAVITSTGTAQLAEPTE
ncbi:unnamed protein product [Parascedosporium putredinis]|uniref:lytic cellulose monooxygenase (C4-dehydrogenating) n=1 Tax=Parascedosporium putredinis TaxID=1442378 RepID=A0A9P1M829_9PEZI|nr:unnamed protein product [Parascedosporium putredinis]CAI7989078.1 unnamed protein product [Parascedosporium putredinis]